MNSLIKQWISEAMVNHINVFEYLMSKMKQKYEAVCYTFDEIQQQSSIILFETFCVLYLKALNYDAWLLKDVPINILAKLGLTNNDKSITIIAYKSNIYSAVYAKYKIKYSSQKNNVLCWRQLNPFYKLCTKSQVPLEKIVMTTADIILKYNTISAADCIFISKNFYDTSDTLWNNIINSDKPSEQNDHLDFTPIILSKPQSKSNNLIFPAPIILGDQTNHIIFDNSDILDKLQDNIDNINNSQSDILITPLNKTIKCFNDPITLERPESLKQYKIINCSVVEKPNLINERSNDDQTRKLRLAYYDKLTNKN
jgi:hypothetical protein